MVLDNQVTLSCHEVSHFNDLAVFFCNDKLIEWVELEDYLISRDYSTVVCFVSKNCAYWDFNFCICTDDEGPSIKFHKFTVEL